jgi:hypothetical protein
MKRQNRHGQGLTLIRFRRWLDQLVQVGLLEKRDRRYYLTDDGWWVATSLGGPLSAHGRIAT